MQFLLACIFYSFIGSLGGFLVHIFNGIIQVNTKFNLKYIKKTTINFFRVFLVMSLVTTIIAILILLTPKSFLNAIGIDPIFLEQLIFYVFTFAAFDFGIKNESLFQ